jgi:hypothetical protein
MARGPLSFGDDVMGNALSPHLPGFEGKTPDNRPVDDIGAEGEGDQDRIQDRPRGIVGLLKRRGYHGHE